MAELLFSFLRHTYQSSCSYENKNWFLTHDIDLYLRCFHSVDKERLQTLMREDLQKWKRELQEAKNNGEQLKLEVQALL